MRKKRPKKLIVHYDECFAMSRFLIMKLIVRPVHEPSSAAGEAVPMSSYDACCFSMMRSNALEALVVMG